MVPILKYPYEHGNSYETIHQRLRCEKKIFEVITTWLSWPHWLWSWDIENIIMLLHHNPHYKLDVCDHGQCILPVKITVLQQIHIANHFHDTFLKKLTSHSLTMHDWIIKVRKFNSIPLHSLIGFTGNIPRHDISPSINCSEPIIICFGGGVSNNGDFDESNDIDDFHWASSQGSCLCFDGGGDFG